jgi:hypothetical protein
MSDLSKQARQKAEDKVERLTRSSNGKVDASGWTEPLGEMGSVKTGPRPVSPRAYKRGGKVRGEPAKMHAGRKPRKSGGRSQIDGGLVNTDVKVENESRAGSKHIGGMAHGGACKCSKCSGGRVGHAAGGGIPLGNRPQGGRMPRKGGGRTKGDMKVNIIIAPSKSGPTMPPPGMGPPPGAGPVGMHQGAPPPMMPPGGAPPMAPPPGMPRKSGGRAGNFSLAKPGKYPLKDGSGGGLGRLEKAKAYG